MCIRDSYTYEGNAELQHIKVIGGNHTWYLNENQTDIAYLPQIYKFFTDTDGGSVGLVETDQNALPVWPNPTSGCFTVQLGTSTTLEVLDAQGRCVARYTFEAGRHQIDLGDLPEGLYFVKGENGAAQKLLLTK